MCLYYNLLVHFHISAISQLQCDGLTTLAITANQSVLLESCDRDSDCTQITCMLVDPSTRSIVQEAVLRVIPCSIPLPQVEFDLLDQGVVGFMQLINSSGEVDIMISNGVVPVPFGTLISFINHTENAIGIMVRTQFFICYCFAMVSIDL